MKTKKIKLPPMPNPYVAPEVVKLLKIDLGCGNNKIGPDWTGVDSIKFDAVDIVTDLTQKWPFEDNSVDEAHSSHFIEHLEAQQRIHFCNELYRVLKPDAKATIIAPEWSNSRAYGDLTHKWPPISDFWFYYLDRNWRLGVKDVVKGNAPHNDIHFNPNGYNCHFECKWGFTLPTDITDRNLEYQQNAMKYWKNVNQDVVSTWFKRVMPITLPQLTNPSNTYPRTAAYLF